MTRALSARREAALAGLGGAALSAVLTWPTLAHPATRVPQDLGDPLLQAWQVAWDGHALATRPWSIFDANTFWPLRRSLAFSDALLGYAPTGLVGAGPTAAVVRYNLLFVFAFALAFLGGFLLARQLGASRLAATTAGVGLAFAPWRFAQAGHLQVLSSGGVPLTLALLARGHAGVLSARTPMRGRPAVALAGWLMAGWQLSLGFGVGLPFAYLLLAVVLGAGVAWWRAGRPAMPRRLLVANVAGMALFAATGGLLALPYLAVVAAHPEGRRTAADIALFSPPLLGFLVPPPGHLLFGSLLAGPRDRLPWPPEMTLAPGVALTLLAAVGVGWGRWSRRRRTTLAAAAVVLTVLALGTSFFVGRWTYLPLLHHLPGWQGLRTPGRLIGPITLALALLAATGVDRLRAVAAGRARRLVEVGLLGAVVLDGVAALPHPAVPAPPVRFATLSDPVLVLTATELDDTAVMLWSTDGFPRVVNGISGFVPREQARLRGLAAAFPSQESRAGLTAAGVRTVVVPLSGSDPGRTAAVVDQVTRAGITVVRRPGALLVPLRPSG